MALGDTSHGMITLSAFAIKHKNIITINIFYPLTTANKKNKPCHSLAGVCRALQKCTALKFYQLKKHYENWLLL
jgi:hypothetical protein